MKKPTEFNNFPKAITNDTRWRNALWRFMAVRRDLTDGDTSWFLIDKGTRDYSFLPIRVDGYDAWELFRGTPEEKARGLKAKEAFDSKIPYNAHVGLITEEDVTLDRWVAQVLYVTSDGTVQDIKKFMVDNGHTKAQILQDLDDPAGGFV